MDDKLRFETLCASIGADIPSATRPLAAPIYQASVFAVDSLELVDDLYEGRKEGYFYSRDANPNVSIFERAMALLENGDDAVAFPSGMAAIGATLITMLSSGDRVVASKELYGRTLQMLREDLPRFGIETDFVDITDLSAVSEALGSPARLILLESISNPLITVADVKGVSALAHRQGAGVVVDNTMATPYHLRPLELGADVVIHSATKYINGHSDVTGGVVIADKGLASRLRRTSQIWGGVPDPFASWLTVRGIKTLPLRMQQASRNAAAVASYLCEHDGIARVYYPGLPSDPSHQVSMRSMEGGFGAMVSFELEGGLEAASSFVRAVKLIKFAPSFGEPQTTLSHPAKTSHRPLSPEQRAQAGIGDGLIRLSCGIESSEDIIGDIQQALRG